jgi:hypothetical protein
MTGNSTLDPDNAPQAPDRTLGKGHGIDALGPSNTSDSGSDIMGAPGLTGDDDLLDLDAGTTSDLERSHAGGTAGPDVGDANLSSDSDADGTGERATAGRDTVVRDGADIDVDHIESIPSVPLDQEDIDVLGSTPPQQRARTGKGKPA